MNAIELIQLGLAIMFAVPAALTVIGYLVIKRLPDEVYIEKQK